MNMIGYLITGGFLKGKRTYILGALLVLQALVSWAVGDLSLQALIAELPEIGAGLGLITARVAVPK